ncbi:hypothetical protein SRHO_G00146310 [Serrasalmus rhombeus]
MTEQFCEVGKLRAELLQDLEAVGETVTSYTEDIARFDKSVGLLMSSDTAVTTIRSDCPSSIHKFALFLKVLEMIYKLVQTDSYATKSLPLLKDLSLVTCVTWRQMAQEWSVLPVLQQSLCPLTLQFPTIWIRLSAKVVEKDATFQRLLDDEFCTRLHPCIIITGKGVPDVNSRLMVRKLWDTLHIPVFALVDADPHGIEIMCIYKYGSVSMAFEAPSLTIPCILWMGLLPSDIERLEVPQDALIPLTKSDESKLIGLRKRPYISCQPAWEREMDIMLKCKQKAEIQCLASIAPHFLTRVYLPNKLHYGGWI